MACSRGVSISKNCPGSDRDPAGKFLTDRDEATRGTAVEARAVRRVHGAVKAIFDAAERTIVKRYAPKVLSL